MKKDNRPVNLDLTQFHWPVMALSSITHRVSGGILFVGIAFMLFALQTSLASEEGFNEIKSMMQHPLGMFITWGLLAALAYHFVAGIKHLFMDMGYGETLEGGAFAAKTTFLFAGILIVLAAIWVLV